MDFAMSRIDILRFVSDQFFGAGPADHTIRVTVTMPVDAEDSSDSEPESVGPAVRFD
ncbi:hypothetical protein D2E23_1901 [Bifidobacterium callimiconis]|uniref:Uncharacterized protein n=2 Tax=Bifidobacterium callimiconis TaxID=2306973 RepID=A0A430FB38_9BIFI|nr:hypothetical protein D2E23_1901 [Bifidobacterium callimiconis]